VGLHEPNPSLSTKLFHFTLLVFTPDHTENMRMQLTNASDYYHIVDNMVGEFEYLILSAAARLGDDAYGAAIRREVEEATKRRCSIGALYTTLDRLQNKGLVETWMGEATPQRGGRAKRMVRVTKKGAQEASSFYRAIMRASRNVSWGMQ
jgi:PadR family transcriptional regulator PadR